VSSKKARRKKRGKVATTNNTMRPGCHIGGKEKKVTEKLVSRATWGRKGKGGWMLKFGQKLLGVKFTVASEQEKQRGGSSIRCALFVLAHREKKKRSSLGFLH